MSRSYGREYQEETARGGWNTLTTDREVKDVSKGLYSAMEINDKRVGV